MLPPENDEGEAKPKWRPPPSLKELFVPPPDPQVVIWRYMDFAKYVWLLQKAALFFSRSDLIGDPFEGSFPVLNSTLRALALQEYGQLQPEKAEEVSQMLAAAARLTRRWVYLNCWHMNEHESAAMWKVYAAGNQAIAIRSTYQRLRNCYRATRRSGSSGISTL